MEQLLKQFDRYGRKARLLPAVLLLLPALATVFAWFPEARSISFGSATALVWLAAGFALSQFSRRAGKSIEKELWQSWDGPPTTRYLRHRNEEFNSVRRATCHRLLQSHVPDVDLPSAEEEADDPARADSIYEACVRYLIRRTRDTDHFDLVFKENINYGFHRNWLGLKPLGVAISVACLALSSWLLWDRWTTGQNLDAALLASAAVGALFVLAYAFWLTPNAVKLVAEAYAERLLEACEDLDETA